MERICFVCMGNICRSPSAEGVATYLIHHRQLAGEVEVDSAGTHAYHFGQPPDARAIAAAARRGIDLSGLRARSIVAEDFVRFDRLLVMDEQNLKDLQDLAPARITARIEPLLQYAPQLSERWVADPYYGGDAGFERMLNLIEHGIEGLLDAIASGRARQASR